jgi:hypothetical protein
MQEILKQQINLITKAFQSQFRQTSALMYINLILGMNPRHQIGEVEAVA